MVVTACGCWGVLDVFRKQLRKLLICGRILIKQGLWVFYALFWCKLLIVGGYWWEIVVGSGRFWKKNLISDERGLV